MASSDSGDSPNNAAIAAIEQVGRGGGGGAQWPGGILFIKYPHSEPHVFSIALM